MLSRFGWHLPEPGAAFPSDALAALPSPAGGAAPAAAPAAYCLAVLADDPATVLAGTADGVRRSADGKTWQPAEQLAAGCQMAVTHLAADRNGVVAGTADGLFQSLDHGATWTRAAGPFAATAVTALAAGAGRIVAAAPFGGYQETEWPGLLVSGKQIDLDRAYPAVVPGSWIVLAQDTGTAGGTTRNFVARKVVSASLVQRRDFQLAGRVTRVIVDPPLGAAFDPRTATAYIYSRPLDLFRQADTPVALLGVPDIRRPGADGGAGTRRLSLSGAIEDLGKQSVSISGRRARARLIGRAGGVRKLQGTSWTQVGSVNHDGQALLLTKDRRFFLGAKSGVYRLDGAEWRVLGELNDSVLALAETSGGAVLAGGEGGIWSFAAEQWTRCGLADPAPSVRALLAVDAARFVAGTDRGIYLSDDGGISWRAASGAVTNDSVNALVRGANGAIIAGTDRGILVGTTDQWGAAVLALGGMVRALAADRHGRLLAAVDNGVFLADAEGAQWQPDPSRLLQGEISAIAVDPAGDEVYFARRGLGVVTRREALPAGIANDVRSLLFGPDGKLHAGSWSSAALLSPDGTKTLAIEPNFVADVTVEGTDLQTRLAAGSVTPAVRHAFAKYNIDLPEQGVVQIEQPGAIWSISGGSAGTYILHAVRPDVVRVFVETDLEVMAPPQPWQGQPQPAHATASQQPAPPMQTWRLRAADGSLVQVMALQADPAAGVSRDIAFTAADPKGDIVSEIGWITSAIIAADRSRTDIDLAAPLATVFDARTVVLNANVAPASHGESPMMYEVLGSGDSSRPNQSFALRRYPVTALATSKPPFHAFEITMRVRPSLPLEPVDLSGELVVRDIADDAVEWQRVETLTTSGRNDRHYVLQEDDAGHAVIRFGDGFHGMRLPTGSENVIATYRVGSGPDGNVAAGTLTLATRRPAGVRRVTNPSSATGGLEADSPNEMRAKAPARVRTLGRIVSLRDYEDFLLSQPGIGKATVRLLPLQQGRGQLIHATVAGTDLDAALPDLDALEAAIANNRSARAPLKLDPAVPLPFRIEALVATEPDRDGDAVRAAVGAMLLARYGFAARNLAEPLHASDVVARIQDVSGVRAVELRALSRSGRHAQVHPVLEAGAARWIKGRDHIQPAGLLLIRSAADIELKAWAS